MLKYLTSLTDILIMVLCNFPFKTFCAERELSELRGLPFHDDNALK